MDVNCRSDKKRYVATTQKDKAKNNSYALGYAQLPKLACHFIFFVISLFVRLIEKLIKWVVSIGVCS